MTDLFLRQRINTLTGLTKYGQLSSDVITLTLEDTWIDIYTNMDTEEHQVLWAYKFTLSESIENAYIRILAREADKTDPLTDDDKIFPFPDSTEIYSENQEELHMPIQIPKNHKFKIQVKGTRVLGDTDHMTAKLDYLSVITIPLYSHTYQNA